MVKSYIMKLHGKYKPQPPVLGSRNYIVRDTSV